MLKKLSLIVLSIIAISLTSVIALSLMKQVEAKNTVLVHYTIRLPDGTVYYTSLGHTPLLETLGEGKFIPGFEEALIGMHLGQAKTVTIPAEKAYGEYDPELVGTVGRDRLPEGIDLVIGKQLWAELIDGTPTLTTITDFTETTITLDANHPLAGLDLTFEIQLLGIDDHGSLGHLTNLTAFSWTFLFFGALALGLVLFLITKRDGFRWLKARWLTTIKTMQYSWLGMRSRRVAWFWILPLLVGSLILGYALVSALVGRKVQIGDTVSVLYTLRLDDGTVYNATVDDEPLLLTLGEGKLISGVEDALLGMHAGESKTVTIPPEKAYGSHRPELVFEYDRSELPEGSQPEVGQQLQTSMEDGSELTMVIVEITGDTVTLDANHPLAGKKLTFDVELVEVDSDPAIVNHLDRRVTALTLPIIILFICGLVFFVHKTGGMTQKAST